jgi:hypothetical protein
MWIYTPWGAFSVVKQRGSTGALTVRARLQSDLEQLRVRHLPTLGPVLHTTMTDYPFRAFVSPADFAKALAEIAEAIDYPNVKAETMRVSGLDRERVYHNIHAATVGLENVGKRVVAPNSDDEHWDDIDYGDDGGGDDFLDDHREEYDDGGEDDLLDDWHRSGWRV